MLSLFKLFCGCISIGSFITELANVCEGGLYAYGLLTTIILFPIILVFCTIGFIASKGVF